MRPLPLHGEGTGHRGVTAAGGAAFDAITAAATFKDSVAAFGIAAHDLLTCDGGYRLARAELVKLYRGRKAEIETMLAAFRNRPWPAEDHLAVRDVGEHALAILDVLFRDFRQALAVLHDRKG
ncbi:hypothetical protein AM571_CH01755 [Rhizobium etli 8C-3]|uniref:Uncharacterized protein n=1 Tax=Rhizobium etli 8C-3 TaxID=538025 RepID=A0A1L5P395_RHIET|nr:hypothetical protein [Rhizobium etli]APO74576.1 hypothetical protein AM571_CH01755 [Rhizobium etli 8C-3]